MEDLIGRELGRYHIIEQLGRGGMAAVYKAYDTRLNRNVAVKVILSSLEQSEEFFTRFEREARALAQLNHPNIVKVHDFGEQDGMPYLVMEYLPGGSLRSLMGKKMPYQEAARIVLPIAKALAYAHQRKIIHRDVKPANILISESGEPMLTDFGIAKMLEATETQALTGTGVGIGTPEYMAPEQGMGRPVDERTDIYALGIVFYELITGRKPFQADTPMAIMVKHMTDPLPRPKTYVPDLPEEVERVIFTADAKKAENRYRNMDSFAADLERLAHQGAPHAVASAGVDITGETASYAAGGMGYAATRVERGTGGATATVLDQPSITGSATVREPGAQPPVRKKKFPVWAIIVIGGVLLVGVLCLIFGGGVLAIPMLSAYLNGDAQSTATPEMALVPTQEPIIEPTPTVFELQLADLSSVRINQQDLPDYFQTMTQTEIDQLGMSEELLASSFTEGLAEATVQNMTAYMSDDLETFEIIASMLIYPLTGLEKTSVDMELLDPNVFLNDFIVGMGTDSTSEFTADVLPGADVVGEKSVGVSFVQTDPTMTLYGEAVMARRERILSLVYTFYLEGTQPISAITLSQILDARLLEAMP